MRMTWHGLVMGILLAGCGDGAEALGPWRPDVQGGLPVTAEVNARPTTLLAMGGPVLATTELVVRGESVLAAVVDGEVLARVVELDSAQPGARKTVPGGFGQHLGLWVGADRLFELSTVGLFELRQQDGRTEYTPPAWSVPSPIVPVAITSVSGQAVVADSGGHFFALDPRMGGVRAIASAAGRPLGMLGSAAGDLVIVTGSGSCEEIGAIQLATLELGSTAGSLRDVRKLARTRCPTGHVAVDATTVYWTQGDGSVWMVPRAGGTALRLAADQETPVGIAVDQTYVYWTEMGHYEASGDSFALRGGAIKRARKADLTVERITLEGVAPFAVAVTPTRLVWTSARGGGVFSMPKD